jgi:hypothetical protein
MAIVYAPSSYLLGAVLTLLGYIIFFAVAVASFARRRVGIMRGSNSGSL